MTNPLYTVDTLPTELAISLPIGVRRKYVKVANKILRNKGSYQEAHFAAGKAIRRIGMDIHGVEIFATGVWKGKKIITKDLEQMARNHAKLSKIRIPLKFGHNDEQKITDGQPALGWVTGLRVVNNKLVADFEQVPEIVHAAIKAGRYDRVSSEVLFGIKAGDEELGTVLIGVALLGADLPVVSDLEGLSKLVASDDFKDAVGFSFEMDADLNYSQEEKTGAGLSKYTGADNKNHPQEVDMDELNKKLAEMKAELEASFKRELETEQGKTSTAEAELKTFQIQAKKEANEKSVALFTASRKSVLDRCNEMVKTGKLVPALRDKIEEAIEVQKDNFSQQGEILHFNSDTVIELLDKFSGAKLPAGEQGTGSGQDDGKGDEQPPDIEVEKLTRIHMSKNGVEDFGEAMIAMLDDPDNKKLAERYVAWNQSQTVS